MKTKLFFLISSLFFTTYSLHSQGFEWANTINDSESNDDEIGRYNLLDNDGNVYTFGTFMGTADLDPGLGVENLSLTQFVSFYIQKLSPEGNLIWVQGFDGVYFSDAAIDPNNNIYISGTFYGTTDFDNGSGNSELTTPNSGAYILKIDSSGTFQWVRGIGGLNGNEYLNNITTDFNGNIYATGAISDTTVDLDPGTGVTILNPINFIGDLFVIRLTDDGDFKWAYNLLDYGYAVGRFIECGPDNQPVLLGDYSDAADFDFGSGTTLLDPYGSQCILKFDSLGNNIWAKKTDYNNTTITDFQIDALGQVYISGGFYDNVDLDWGPGQFLVSTQDFGDLFFLKTDSNGDLLWAKTMGSAGKDEALTISIDSSFNVYVGGYFGGNIDLDPGISSVQFNNIGAKDYFIVSLSSQGNYNWAQTAGDSKDDQINSLIVDKSGFLYATGFVEGLMDVDAGANTFMLNTVSKDILNLKLGIKQANICMVTVDTNSIHNIVYWDKSQMENIDSIFVFRETTTNNYNIIASVHFDSLGQFIDTVSQQYFPYTGNPNMGTYRYKIQTKDKWGGLSQKSPYHNTIFAINIFGTFDWNDYLVEGQSSPIPQLGAYLLWRDDISNGNWQVVGAVAGTQTTITDPQYPNYPNGSWRVLTDWSISCDPTRAGVNTSRSNIKNSPSISNTILENGNFAFTIYPNPATEIITIQSENSFDECVIRILDITGKEIQNLNSTDSKISLDVSNFASGVYFIRIETELGIHLEKVTVE